MLTQKGFYKFSYCRPPSRSWPEPVLLVYARGIMRSGTYHWENHAATPIKGEIGIRCWAWSNFDLHLTLTTKSVHYILCSVTSDQGPTPKSCQYIEVARPDPSARKYNPTSKRIIKRTHTNVQTNECFRYYCTLRATKNKPLWLRPMNVTLVRRTSPSRVPPKGRNVTYNSNYLLNQPRGTGL